MMMRGGGGRGGWELVLSFLLPLINVLIFICFFICCVYMLLSHGFIYSMCAHATLQPQNVSF